MRKASKTIYNICQYLYLALAIVFAVLGVLYCSVFLIGKTSEEAWKLVGKGVGLIIASSIVCAEAIFARRAYQDRSTNVTALVWGIVGVVGSYSVGTLMVIGAIFGLVADNQEPKVIEAPKEDEEARKQ